ncbi:MAG TPA: transcription-repair coupling factor, partial [Acidimicrobiaceae bacterium]|nr:transcription-repair coupling factor [Acidimicrobiaceae bacterium]
MSVATSASRSVTALNPLVALLRDHPALLGTLSLQSATLTVPEAAQSFVLAGIAQGSRRTPLVVVVATTAEADRVAADLSTLLGEDQVDLFPAWETLPFERVSPSVETMGRRMRTMWHLQDPDRAPAVLVASARALVQRLGPHVEDVEPIVMTRGERCDQTEFLNALIAAGYRREYQVEHRGEVAVRGSIIDVFGSTDDEPIRIDLWGDEIERLTTFSVSDQRSDRDLDRVELFPCRELLPTDAVRARAQALMASAPWGSEQWQRLADGETFDGMESWLPWLADDGGDAAEHVLLDLLDERAQIVLLEPRRIRSRASEILLEEVDLAASLATTWGADSSSELPRLHQDFDRLLTRTSAAVWTMSSLAEVGSALVVSTLPWALAAGDGDQLTRQLSQLSAEKFRVVVAAETPSSAERIERVLRERGLGYSIVAEGGAALAEPGSRIAVASLQRGFILPDIKLAVLCETDFTGRRRTHRVPKASKRHAQTFFDDLAVGSYVVHHHHGVARFGGMVKRNIGGSERDYLLLEYRGEDRLYVPSDQIDAIRHYTGGDTPTLSKMGGSDFAKTKAKVRAEVATVAQELVVLYQTRMNSLGHAFGQDTPWQREMEEDFPFAETPDQLSAIAEVKADMEAEKPMDRLVIGDVGFGKTEVAIRAAFKACQDGFQVAVLVPTTLLAQQHYSTFAERFSPYPLRVEVLSRFLTNKEARTVIEGLASGEVDVVIGTHRLLSG